MTNNKYKESLITEAIMTGLDHIGQGVQDMFLRDDSKLVVLIDQSNIAVFPFSGSRKGALDMILDEINTLRLLGTIQPPSAIGPEGWEYTDYLEPTDDPM